MGEHLVLVIDDSPPNKLQLQSIETALANEFAGLNETFIAKPRKTDLTRESLSSVVSDIGSTADVVLVDANIPASSRDGVRLINALRGSGFAGFTYLWSSSSPANDVELFPTMLKRAGAGGFLNSAFASLAIKVRKDWEACGNSFEVANPKSMNLVDPIESALQILSEFLPGSLLSEIKQNGEDTWNSACQRASDLFSVQPGNFRSLAASFPKHNTLRLDDASDFMTRLCKADFNDHDSIFKDLTDLRDALLDVAKSCQDAM